VFRGKYLQGLRQAYDSGALQFAGSTAALAHRPAFNTLVSTLYGKAWVVYAKKPFAGAAVLLKYLTRYTHRVALDNRRLVKLADDTVTLTYKEYAAGGVRQEMTLPVVELLRRFALHIVPGGFVRIRHYGLLTHRDRGVRLARCRALLAGGPLLPSASPAMASAGPLSVPLAAVVALVPAAAANAGLSAVAPPRAAASAEVSDDLCRSCRHGCLQTFWFADRPHGRDVERHWVWNTS